MNSNNNYTNNHTGNNSSQTGFGADGPQVPPDALELFYEQSSVKSKGSNSSSVHSFDIASNSRMMPMNNNSSSLHSGASSSCFGPQYVSMNLPQTSSSSCNSINNNNGSNNANTSNNNTASQPPPVNNWTNASNCLNNSFYNNFTDNSNDNSNSVNNNNVGDNSSSISWLTSHQPNPIPSILLNNTNHLTTLSLSSNSNSQSNKSSNYTDRLISEVEQAAVEADESGDRRSSNNTKHHHHHKNKETIFLEKLLDALEIADLDPHVGSALRWQAHGHSFKILNPELFENKIQEQFFRQKTKFKSFQRQLNLWGFKKVSRGLDAGAYFHPLFRRGNREVVMRFVNDREKWRTLNESKGLKKSKKRIGSSGAKSNHNNSHDKSCAAVTTFSGDQPHSKHSSCTSAAVDDSIRDSSSNGRDQHEKSPSKKVKLNELYKSANAMILGKSNTSATTNNFGQQPSRGSSDGSGGEKQTALRTSTTTTTMTRGDAGLTAMSHKENNIVCGTNRACGDLDGNNKPLRYQFLIEQLETDVLPSSSDQGVTAVDNKPLVDDRVSSLSGSISKKKSIAMHSNDAASGSTNESGSFRRRRPSRRRPTYHILQSIESSFALNTYFDFLHR